MQTIKLQVHEEIIKLFGMKGVQKLLEEELAYQKFCLSEKKIQQALSSASIVWEQEFDRLREEAFKEYRKRKEDN